MKKSWIALMAIVLISLVPLALARVTIQGSSDTSASTENSGASEDTHASAQVSASAGSDADNGGNASGRHGRVGMRLGQDMQDKMQQWRKDRNESISVVKDIRAMKRATREEISSQRAELKMKLDALKDCKGQNTQECEEARSNAKSTVIASLKTDIAQVSSLLDSAKTRVSESKLENKDEIAADLDAQINAVASVKVEIDALSDSSSKADAQKAAKDLRKVVQEARQSLQAGAHSLVANKLGDVIQLSQALETRLNNALAHLKAKGMDTSSIDVTSFKAKINVAAQAHQEGIVLMEQAKAAQPGQKDELMKQATQKFQDSQKSLKDAHALLQDILRSIKTLKGGNDVLASTSTTTSASATASS